MDIAQIVVSLGALLGFLYYAAARWLAAELHQRRPGYFSFDKEFGPASAVPGFIWKMMWDWSLPGDTFQGYERGVFFFARSVLLGWPVVLIGVVVLVGALGGAT